MRAHRLPRTIALLSAFATSACTDGAPLAPDRLYDARASLSKDGRGNQTITEQQVTISIPYDAEDSPEVCGLPARVDGTGTLRVVTKVVETGSGTVHVTISSTASGTATGGDGSTYTWTYAQKLREFDATSLPTTFRIVDQFHLMGRDGAPSYKVAFHLTVVLGPDGVPISLDYGKERGNFGQCDPL